MNSEKVNKEKLTDKKNTGSPEFQISLFTKRIRHLSEHLKINKKDNSSRMGLLRLVGKKKKLLSYLKKTNLNRYKNIILNLNLRK